MASSFSSTFFAPSLSSSSAAKVRIIKNLTPGLSPANVLHHNPISTRSSNPRVGATLLQDNEDKVIVEESAPSKTSFIDTNKGSSEESSSSSSSNTFEKWVIKLEQSTNIFLTVTIIVNILAW